MRIHILHTGKVHVSPYLPYGGDDCSIIKAAGVFVPKKRWLWLPVSAYLIEHSKGLVLVDTGWERAMSPEGKYSLKAQIRSLGSLPLYLTNQGILPAGESVPEQLAKLGYKTSDIDYVLLTHLDCDHANGLSGVRDAKNFLVADDEFLGIRMNLTQRIRYQVRWWKDIPLTRFSWNGTEGPAGKSFDLFDDGSLTMINIPGHSTGLCAVKVKNIESKYVLLFSDGGYSTRSWKEQILPGISQDKTLQKMSLEWIREESLSPDCIASLANHDPDVNPHVIEL